MKNEIIFKNQGFTDFILNQSEASNGLILGECTFQTAEYFPVCLGYIKPASQNYGFCNAERSIEVSNSWRSESLNSEQFRREWTNRIFEISSIARDSGNIEKFNQILDLTNQICADYFEVEWQKQNNQQQ